MEVKTVTSQSLLDLSIQMGGSAESVFALALQNNLSITDALQAGQTLELSNVTNQPIADYYRIKRITPATDITVNNSDNPQGSGIEFWAIEVDFIVS